MLRYSLVFGVCCIDTQFLRRVVFTEVVGRSLDRFVVHTIVLVYSYVLDAFEVRLHT